VFLRKSGRGFAASELVDRQPFRKGEYPLDCGLRQRYTSRTVTSGTLLKKTREVTYRAGSRVVRDIHSRPALPYDNRLSPVIYKIPTEEQASAVVDGSEYVAEDGGHM
jgi:hypothetical protein